MHVPQGNKRGHAIRVTMGLGGTGQAAEGRRTASAAPINVLKAPPRVKGKGPGRRLLSALLGLGLLAVSACATPTLRPATPTGTGPVIQDVQGLRIAVEAEAWHGRPRTLPDHILPFLILVRNNGGAAVTIRRSDFLLLDDANRQYIPLAPAEVVTMLGGGASGVGVSPSVGVAGSTAGSTVFGVGLGISLGATGTDTRDIIPQALGEGPLLAGAESKGFIYFLRPTPGFQSLRLVVAPQDLPGQPRLDFEFRRTGS
ncbi:MAG: hypothetical protein HY713_05670 [candidate division NC10 bacterium]|nr:hypothetical protein [candidate division NC10 bacterium]